MIVRHCHRFAAACVPALFALLMTAGCDAPPDLAGEVDPGADTLSALLVGVDDAPFRQAFTTLRGYDYTRYIRTEQFDGEDFMVAYREQVARMRKQGDGWAAETLETDSAGAFDFGFFRQFVSENIDDLDPVDLVPYLLEEDPPYLQARNLEKYSYRTLTDTLLWDAQARVIEVRAKPVFGDGENVRRVRFYVDRQSEQLVAMSLERIDLALLFREESQFYVHMRPAPDGSLIPYNTRFHTLIRTPFRTDHQFRTVSTYYDAVPRGEGG